MELQEAASGVEIHYRGRIYKSGPCYCRNSLIQSLLSELGVSAQNKALVWCDSLAVVAVASNPVMHSKFKHVELDLFFVREKVANGSFQVGHDQIVDILTKPLSVGLFDKFRRRLRVVSTRGDDMKKQEKSISMGHVMEYNKH
ncbi:hypothetical protein EPI10_022108 [Gossypium australe]|uniref:Uncharacterized protein n=1 Tax=Gossypium australe TaxID=47621 RepID=A0A5B6WIZ1_9ROSI|nr:hypothetical protein EPI10_022108 [Gossypium australe]